MNRAIARLLHNVEKLQVVVIVIAASGDTVVRTVGRVSARGLGIVLDLELRHILRIVLVIVGRDSRVVGQLDALRLLGGSLGESALALGLGRGLARGLGAGAAATRRGSTADGASLGQVASFHAMRLEDALEPLGTGRHVKLASSCRKLD